MNKQTFTKLIADPSQISTSDLTELEKVIESFPYCQPAHILIAKGANDAGSMLSSQKLHKAAVYTVDRAQLRKLLQEKSAADSKDVQGEALRSVENSKNFPVQTTVHKPSDDAIEVAPAEKPDNTFASTPITKETEEKQQETPSDEKISTEGTLSEDKKDTSPDVVEESESDKISFFQELERNLERLKELKAKNNLDDDDSNNEKKTPIQTKPLDASDRINIKTSPLSEVFLPNQSESNKNKDTEDAAEEDYNRQKEVKEMFISPSITTPAQSLSESEKELQTGEAELYLEYIKYLNQKRAKYKRNKQKDDALISKFILEDPIIPYLRPDELSDKQEDLSRKSTKISRPPASENYAKILVLQKKYDKALEIYQELILKNPEKSTYFAGKIEEIKLKINK